MAHLSVNRLPFTARFIVALLLFVTLSFARMSAAIAQDFRISTKIYVGEDDEKDTKLVSESTTLFYNGAVYDFLADGSQTAVFRKLTGKEGRFILLNPDERIRHELTTKQLENLVQGVRTWAASQKDEMLKFAANPEFKESFEPEPGRLILASSLQTYTVTTQPVKHPEAIAEYREFLNWYTQLNIMLHGNPSKLPRMRLNDALARHRVVPEVVTLTMAGEKEPIRAVHEFTMRLSRDDMAKIEEVHTSLASFREVTNDEFVKAMQPTATLK
jgi:hypothetical protein